MQTVICWDDKHSLQETIKNFKENQDPSQDYSLTIDILVLL